jgi:hypothetical protein
MAKKSKSFPEPNERAPHNGSDQQKYPEPSPDEIDSIDMEALLSEFGNNPEEADATDDTPAEELSWSLDGTRKVVPHSSGDRHFYWKKSRTGGRILTFDVHHRKGEENLPAYRPAEWFARLEQYAQEADRKKVIVIHGCRGGTAWQQEVRRYFGEDRCQYILGHSMTLVTLET